MYEFVEITSVEALDDHAEMWAQLLEQTPRASHFQSVQWLKARWRHAKPEEQIIVVAVVQGKDVIGLVPVCICPQDTKLGQVYTASFPHAGWCSFYGPVSARPQETLLAALDYLKSSPHRIDTIEFSNFPDYTAAISSRHVSEEEVPTQIYLGEEVGFEVSKVAMLDLADDWETYWESRRAQKNRRRNVQRCERRLAELGEIRYERYRPEQGSTAQADLRWDLYDTCESIASNSWQDGLVDGNTMHHDEVRPFLREAHIGAVAAGAIDINLLYLDDRAIAFVYAYHFKGYVDLVRIGFVPDMAKLAPGNALWTRLIEDSFLRGDKVLDFGPTCLDYKRFWMSRLEPSYSVEHYSKSVKAQGLRSARWVKRQVNTEVDDSNERNKELARENAKASRPCGKQRSQG